MGFNAWLEPLMADWHPSSDANPVDWPRLGRHAQLLARSRDQAQLLDHGLAALLDGCRANAAAIWLFDIDAGRLSLAAERGLDGETGARPHWSDLFKLPLTTSGMPLGAIEIYRRDGEFGELEKGLCQIYGATIASGIERLRLTARVAEIDAAATRRDEVNDYELLWHLGAASGHAVDYPQLFEGLLQGLTESLEFDAAVLLTMAGPQPEGLLALERQGHSGLREEILRRACAAFEAYGDACPIVDPAAVRVVGSRVGTRTGESLKSGFAVPLTQDELVVGVIYVAAVRPDAFNEQQIRVLHKFAEHASVSMARVRDLITVELDRLATIIHSLPQGIVLLDAEGGRLMSNQHGQQHLALLNGPGHRVERLGTATLAELIDAAIAGGNDLVRREMELRQADTTTHLAVTVVPVREEDDMIGVVLATENITEKRQTEQRLFHDARLASIGEFASGLAHELNNPMMIILGISEVLSDDDIVGQRYGGLLDDMQAATFRAADIVKKLMKFADTQRDGGWDTLPLPDVLAQSLDLVVNQGRREGISIEVEWEPELAPVHGNGGKLQQLLLSLVRNATDAISQSGEGGRIEVRGRRVGDEVWLEVEDDGPGILPELRDKIFDVFFSTKRDYQGKGLGLSIAHRIAQEHNGALTLEDGDLGGALFRLRLPAYSFDDAG